MRPPPQRYGARANYQDWDDDDDEPSAGTAALRALGVMVVFFAIGIGAAFGYYRMSAPKVIGAETPVTSPTVAPTGSPSASPNASPNASPSATKTSFHYDPTGALGAQIVIVAE
jgi:hypothetical protein